MPVFSLGVSPAAKRDMARIVSSAPPHLQNAITATRDLLMDEIRVDPHLKGDPAPMLGYPHLRRLDSPPLRMFFWVRQPPLMDLYVEVLGFSRI